MRAWPDPDNEARQPVMLSRPSATSRIFQVIDEDWTVVLEALKGDKSTADFLIHS